MVVNTKNGDNKQRTVSKKKLFSTTFLGTSLLIILIALFYFDPVLYVVQYKLRVENGSMVHDLLRRRFTGPKLYLYMYNVTNAAEFLSGDDEKVKLEEIGPFVFQEYRTNEDVEINKDPGIMRYTPQLESVFLAEESIGDPKNINVTVPNIAMLSATALLSKYPFVVRQIFNMVVASSHSKAFVNLRAHDHIWGYNDNLIQLANNVVPGLVYYKSAGLLERSYDVEIAYRLELGTQDSDKFSVKKATKMQLKSKNNGTALIDGTFTYKDTYEGAMYPTSITPDTPLHLYRHGLCKTFHFEYVASRRMPYGGDAFVYHLHNDTFNDRQLCDSKGWCPQGLKNMADCYFGFPVCLSKGHFLDSDPRLLEMVEGLKPDKTRYDTNIIVDPKIGVTVTGSMSLQLNLFLSGMSFNPHTRRLQDTVLPVSNIIVKAPLMIEEVNNVFRFLYKQGPYILLSTQILCALLGVLLLSMSVRMMYCIRLARNVQGQDEKAIPLG